MLSILFKLLFTIGVSIFVTIFLNVKGYFSDMTTVVLSAITAILLYLILNNSNVNVFLSKIFQVIKNGASLIHKIIISEILLVGIIYSFVWFDYTTKCDQCVSVSEYLMLVLFFVITISTLILLSLDVYRVAKNNYDNNTLLLLNRSIILSAFGWTITLLASLLIFSSTSESTLPLFCFSISGIVSLLMNSIMLFIKSRFFHCFLSVLILIIFTGITFSISFLANISSFVL